MTLFITYYSDTAIPSESFKNVKSMAAAKKVVTKRRSVRKATWNGYRVC